MRNRLARFWPYYFLGCGTGYYSVYPNSSSCECEPCPIGTYNDREFTDSCTACPEGVITLEEGSTRFNQCRLSMQLHKIKKNLKFKRAYQISIAINDIVLNVSMQETLSNYKSMHARTVSLCSFNNLGCELGYWWPWIQYIPGDECIPCFKGTYSDTDDAVECTYCPSGYTGLE